MCLHLSAAGQSPEALAMMRNGLINVQDADPNIVVKLMYAEADNFVGESMYGTLREAMLQPEAAEKLTVASNNLKKKHPRYSMIVYDAARPRKIQQIMWNKVKGTPKSRYVSSPKRISMHSYGVAVDVSLLDENGLPLDMGTPVDYLGELAEPRREQEFLKSGKLTRKQIDNRLLLRNIMKNAGFRSISNEWWHFEACTREEAQRKYLPVDFF
ncbi:MAG: M15 family metallopeptidase [Prevotellaceae bacterium]|nr:M15 family metallopeptidase [Prevotellaceae bacterium]